MQETWRKHQKNPLTNQFYLIIMMILHREVTIVDLKELELEFKRNIFRNEDDIKIHFHSDIIKPLLAEFNPERLGQYRSENTLKAGGRTDATFQNITFELKKEGYFSKKAGVEEALYGRNDSDHGLYDYIISNSDIDVNDKEEVIVKKILDGIGVGFDGNEFIFARFVPSSQKSKVDTKKVKINIDMPLNLEFRYERKGFLQGLKRLALLVKQQSKMSLTKQSLCDVINSKQEFVRNSIRIIYENLKNNLTPEGNFNNRVKTLYSEWDRVFGVMYGTDEEATDFTEVSSKIREMYGIENTTEIDSKMYLFSILQFLK